MEDKLAQYITDFLVEQKIIEKDDVDVYLYGLELILSFIINTLIILILGIILHRVDVTIVFLLIFISLRRFTGGYHAQTRFRCKISIIITHLIVMIFSVFYDIGLIECMFLGILSFILIIRYGPIENIYKPLTYEIRKKNKIFSLVFISILISVGSIVNSKSHIISNAIFFTLVSVIALMIIPIIERRKIK